MYSNDIENIILNINSIKETTIQQIEALNLQLMYRIWNDPHLHTVYVPVIQSSVAVGTTMENQSYESATGPDYAPITTAVYTDPIIQSAQPFNNSNSLMNNIKGQMYKPAESVNNSYGSPWTEGDKLVERITAIQNFAAQHPILNYINEKRALMNLLQLVIPCCVDAKWAIIYYHDILSRGYDEVYNRGEESVKWEYDTADNRNNKKGSNFLK